MTTQQYDFSKGKRGRPVHEESSTGKTGITIRIDDDIVEYFLSEADKSGGEIGYQTLINKALRQHLEGKAPQLDEMLRRIVREEMAAKPG